MDHFEYRDGALHCEALAVEELTARFGTPLYVYSQRTIVDHYRRFRDAFASLDPTICFSIKSCSNLSVLRLLKEQGSSFDVVSGGELARALEIGADPSRIVFAGVGKTGREISQAIEAEIGWFNAESEAELEQIAKIASDAGVTVRVALRINPDVDPHTHQYTTTGTRETKFGVDIDRARKVFSEFSRRQGIELSGIHLHIGSPVNTVEPYGRCAGKAIELIDRLRDDGHSIRAINLGGGFGAHYEGSEAPFAAAYAKEIVPPLAGRGLEVLFEPGRSIVANAGILVMRTLYTKQSGDRKFVIVDGSITELIRPALYGSFHFAWPVSPDQGLVPPERSASLSLSGTESVDIVGPVCESGDFLAKDRMLPKIEQGDLVTIFSTGAYGFSMSSQYNSRPRAAEVLVDGDNARLIRRRETYDDLVEAERV